MNFPLIYANGDSYVDPAYHPSLIDASWPNFVAQFCNGFVINQGKKGSCNRRIIRTTVHDIIHQRKLNPTQKIIALIGLSFEMRSEIWIDNPIDQRLEQESNFRTHSFSSQLNWRENLLSGKDIDTRNHQKQNKKFLDKFSQGRAFFYSPYAERINLLTDLVMLRSLLESLKVDFLIFQHPIAEPLEHDYLLDFLKNEINSDLRFFDFEKFGFVPWCYNQGFTPLDSKDRTPIAHYGPDAHQAFAEYVLIPKLKQLHML
jgi:hypothetical protein